MKDEIYLISMFSYRIPGSRMDFRYFVSRHRLQRAGSPLRLIDGSSGVCICVVAETSGARVEEGIAIPIGKTRGRNFVPRIHQIELLK